MSMEYGYKLLLPKDGWWPMSYRDDTESNFYVRRIKEGYAFIVEHNIHQTEPYLAVLPDLNSGIKETYLYLTEYSLKFDALTESIQDVIKTEQFLYLPDDESWNFFRPTHTI